MNIGINYCWMRKCLKNMDEKQLLELWHDIGNIDAIQRIADTAYEYTENYDYENVDNIEPSISDEQDAINVDNARRAREAKHE